MTQAVSTRLDIGEMIRRIVKHHASATRELILAYFDDDNDPDDIAAEVLDGMIVAGDLTEVRGRAALPGGKSKPCTFVRLPKGLTRPGNRHA